MKLKLNLGFGCRGDAVQGGAVDRGDRRRGGQEREAAQAPALLHRQQRAGRLRGLTDGLALREAPRVHQRRRGGGQGRLLKLPLYVLNIIIIERQSLFFLSFSFTS